MNLYILIYPCRPHGSVDVQYFPMGIYDHLSTGGEDPIYLHTAVVTCQPPPTHRGAGIISTPGPVDPYSLRGRWGGTGRAGSDIYIYLVGGLKHFLFSPIVGMIIQSD